jgi:nucleoside 2-deoxyribosyltransferase
MPISTPESLASLYASDPKHFSHVLEFLFCPAIEKAGLTPIPPIAKGSDVIHAEIIKNLETADLVLCDISGLNPNVLFELGCRTALNRPVCYVMDDHTAHIPFDTGIINHHTYSSSLAPWTLDDERARLAEHIKASAERSEGKNMLWQYFGLRTTAQPGETRGEEAERLQSTLLQDIVSQVESIKRTLQEQTWQGHFRWPQLGTNIYGGEVYSRDLPITTYAWAEERTKSGWRSVIEQAQRDLAQILVHKRPGQPLPSLMEIKFLLDAHIKKLTELVDAEPSGVDLVLAKRLLAQYQELESGQGRSGDENLTKR